MSKSISRRKLITGAAVAPLALNGAAHAAPAKPGREARTAPAPAPDPVVAKAAAWMAAYDAREALIREWQHQETALFAKVKAAGLSVDRGMRSQMPEARAMRALDRKIKTSRKKLDRDAGRIVLMRATSAQGALAKIRVGLRIQGPYDWNDEIVEALVQDGCEQLALMLAGEG
jgi:hypothetical protein